MIKSIRHKGLRNYWTKGETRCLNAEWMSKLRRIMLALDAATTSDEMKYPGSYFHALSGDRQGDYSVRLTGNYRVTFSWEDEFATHVDIEDYH